MMTIVIPMSALTSAPTTPTQALLYDASPEMEEEVEVGAKHIARTRLTPVPFSPHARSNTSTVRDVFWFFSAAQGLHLNLQNVMMVRHRLYEDPEPLTEQEAEASVELFQYTNTHIRAAFHIHPRSVGRFAKVVAKCRSEIGRLLPGAPEYDGLTSVLRDLLLQNDRVLDQLPWR